MAKAVVARRTRREVRAKVRGRERRGGGGKVVGWGRTMGGWLAERMRLELELELRERGEYREGD